MSMGNGFTTRRRFLAGAGGLAGAALLAACAVAPAASDGEMMEEKEAPKEAEAPQAEIIEVVWACYNLGEARNKTLHEMKDVCNNTLPNRRTRLETPTENFLEKIRTEFVAGTTTYDIVVNQINWVQAGARTGLFLPISDYMKRDGVSRDDYIDSSSWEVNGIMYGLAFLGGGDAIYYNKDLFDNDGVPYPELGTTYEQLLEGATKMTKQTGDETTQWGYNFGYSSLEVNLGSFVLDHGGQVLNEARDKALYGEDQNAIAGAQLYVDMILKHRVVPWGEERQALREEGGSGRHIGTGKVAMSQITLIPLKGAYDVLGESLGIAPLGTGPAGTRSPATGSNGWSIMSLTEVPDAAWDVFNVLSQKEAQDLYAVHALPGLFDSAEVFLGNYPGMDWATVLDHWRNEGRDFFLTPETGEFWTTANQNLQPMYTGESTVQEAMKTSADAVNVLFSQRPDDWK